MTKDQLRALIDANITNKNTRHSISPADVGNTLKQMVADGAMEQVVRNLGLRLSALEREGEQKEVISVPTYTDLEQIADPSVDKVYITEDTSKIYLWNGSAFVEQQPGRPTDDNVIYDNDGYDDTFRALYDATNPLTKGVYTIYYLNMSQSGRAFSDCSTLYVASERSGSFIIDRHGFLEVNATQTGWTTSVYAYKSDIADLQQRFIEAQTGGTEKEVIAVAYYAALEALTDPVEEVIYITIDDNKLYIYQNSEFVNVNREIIDNTYYVNSIDELLTASFTEAGTFQVVEASTRAWAMNREYYTMLVKMSTQRTMGRTYRFFTPYLTTRDGWAEKVTVDGTTQWKWHLYEYQDAHYVHCEFHIETYYDEDADPQHENPLQRPVFTRTDGGTPLEDLDNGLYTGKATLDFPGNRFDGATLAGLLFDDTFLSDGIPVKFQIYIALGVSNYQGSPIFTWGYYYRYRVQGQDWSNWSGPIDHFSLKTKELEAGLESAMTYIQSLEARIEALEQR